jgi:hypothetical protein
MLDPRPPFLPLRHNGCRAIVAGVEFIAENGGGAGVRLRKR